MLSHLLVTGALVASIVALSASSAAADGPPGHHGDWQRGKSSHRPPSRANTCTGTPEAPGVLAGVYFGNVSIEGFCEVNAGQAHILGNLTARPGSVLLAAFGLDDQAGSGSSSLTVAGDLRVQSGATALLGCDPEHFACIDDPEPEHATLSSQDRIFGSLREQQPLGVVVHNSVILGNLSESGGGGGETCEPSGVFATFGSPVYSDYEDTTVGGNLNVSEVTSCWMGVIRDHVGGNVRIIDNQLADPDAIEILSNQIAGNLKCLQNSQTWDSSDETEAPYPRAPGPNTVGGRRTGQCVLASPATEGGPLGPGAF
ncbi:MAG: hypothetical protein WAN93_14435 [Solirubrobacteraceae bacterium]